jgi:hypothetical protein
MDPEVREAMFDALNTLFEKLVICKLCFKTYRFSDAQGIADHFAEHSAEVKAMREEGLI